MILERCQWSCTGVFCSIKRATISRRIWIHAVKIMNIYLILLLYASFVYRFPSSIFFVCHLRLPGSWCASHAPQTIDLFVVFDVATALLQVKFHTLMRIHEPWFGIYKCSILSSGNQLCGTTPIRWFVNTQPGWFLSYLCCAYCFQASDGGRRCSTCWLVPAGCYYRWQLVFNIYRFSTKRLNNVLVKLSEISLQCWISTHLLPSIW